MPFSIEEQSTRTSMIMQQTADHFLSLRVMKLSPYEQTILLLLLTTSPMLVAFDETENIRTIRSIINGL